jgi:hypothetical protein
MSTLIDPVQAVADRQALRLWLGIGLTLGLLALSVLTLWAVDNVVVSVGPFDRGSLGWLAAPLWLVAPVGGGFIWSSLTVRWTRVAAGVVGVIVSGAASLAVWQWFGTPLDCGFGTVTPAIDFLPQTVLVGVLVGGGLALTAALVTALVRLGVRWWAVVVGVGTETSLVVVTWFIFFAIGGSHTCFVPGPALGQP